MQSENTEAASSWMPTASLTALKQSARLRCVIHQWMQSQDVLEVCTPALSGSATTDPFVESLVVRPCRVGGKARYLHTSPEFAMKRILCAYPEQDIYQIARVFRAEEQGRYHVSQFSLLEWYRTGMNHLTLMQDVEALLRTVWIAFQRDFAGVDKCSYSQEVFKRLGHWPDDLSAELIKQYFDDKGRSFPPGIELDRGAALDLFIDEFVLPEFDKSRLTFLYEYPRSQASLARIGKSDSGHPVAERFEVYAGQVELANGFHELADATQQRQRFEQDSRTRQERTQQHMPIDENLLSALSAGLPDCAGIAVGLDRLLMVLCDYTHINQVLSFGDDNA